MPSLASQLQLARALMALLGSGLLLAVASVLLWILTSRSGRRRLQADHDLEMSHLKAEYESQLQAAASRTHAEEKQIRKDAVKRSKSTVTGQVLERVAPHLPGFTYNPRDMRFFGDPFDYVVMPGYSEDEIQEIVILEIKAGKGSLNPRQRQLRDRIAEGKVRWEVCHLDTDGSVHPAGGS
jgi:predicted Holliday junction resolvase-like endonuclease